ncbi:hypothetical protein [Halomarina oriensis]|uniref:Sulfatase-like hydrolase/transferase n=1 Tax=Halomarina oriensis TaxID=671145 RepID=A0A6B0GQN2_9EURY|nr:hypothetical protein [Halomarina oriensis]MWG34435.1 hypothetical protein [Halomarina oriensis]
MLPDRYSLANLRRALSDPNLLLREPRRFAHSLSYRINEFFYSRQSREEVVLAEEDWDVLVILDGCRYDLFAGQTVVDGTLSKRYSSASESWEYMQDNFVGRTFHDTVYITANPHWYKLADDVFHDVVDMLELDWDDDLHTVHPADVVERAKRVDREYPDKRLVVHFMQPHFPFIGPASENISHKGLSRELGVNETGEMNIWRNLELTDDHDPAAVVEAYEENLELTLPHVRELCESITGRTVVTADHGNLVGERLWPIPIRGYGHPRDLHAPGLVTVPWLVCEDERRAVRSDPPEAVERQDDGTIEERLSALGYV